MDSGPFRIVSEDAETLVRVGAPIFMLGRPLPSDVAWAIHRFERATAMDAVLAFEIDLAAGLEIDDVVCIWIDPARGAWSPIGDIEPQLAAIAADAARTGHRIVIDHLIVEPLGEAPASAAIAFKAEPERLFRQHTLRTIGRVVERIAPLIVRMADR